MFIARLYLFTFLSDVKFLTEVEIEWEVVYEEVKVLPKGEMFDVSYQAVRSSPPYTAS